MNCYRCSSDNVVSGRIEGGEGACFKPDSVKIPSFKLILQGPYVDFSGQPAYACRQCGLLTTNLDADKLERVIEKFVK